MKVFPIESISLEEAKQLQFKLVDAIQRNFNGYEFFHGGDYGVVPSLGQPTYTRKVEKVLADFFGTEDAILVRGSGTGAIRNVMNSLLKANEEIIVHDAPIYPTTKVIVDSMGLKVNKVDYHDIKEKDEAIIKNTRFALIQHSRQKLDDHYNLGKVISNLKKINPAIKILIDDNYVVMKVEKMGTQLGADVSAFSMFKLLGPEGVGCIVGKKEITDKIRSLNYSGGSQVQGFEAMDALRSLVYAPVSLAIQAEEGDRIVKLLNDGAISGVKNAFIANAQSRVVLVELEEPIAKKILEVAPELGAAPYPIGAESRYEIGAMFYRVSGTFLKADKRLGDYMVRINPMRSGSDTVIRILKQAIEQVTQ